MFFNNPKNHKNYDLVIVGNNLAAVVSAGMAAKTGKSVALVTESELLLSEYSEGLLGFVKEDSNLFSLLTSFNANPVDLGKEHQIPAGMASKIALEFLKQNNVNVYLKAAPVGLIKAQEKVCGIALATKFGAFTLKASFVSNFSNRKFYVSEQSQTNYHYAIQMGGVDLNQISTPYSLDAPLNDIWDIKLHSDCRSTDTCIITFKTNEKHTYKAIEKSTELIDFLIKNLSVFAHSGLLKYSLRPIPLEIGYNTPKKNLLEFKAGDILLEDDYYNAVTFATSLINSFLENSAFIEPTTLEMTYGEFDLAPLYTGEELDEFLGAELLKIKIPAQNAPTKKKKAARS